MAEIKFTNGALVHRIYGEAGAELTAYFQYDLDAKMFVAAKILDDHKHRLKGRGYSITCLYSGKMEMFPATTPAKTEA